MGEAKFKNAITKVMHVVGEANAYIAENEPWKLAKDPAQRDRLATVLWTALQVVSDCNAMLTPLSRTPRSACTRRWVATGGGR